MESKLSNQTIKSKRKEKFRSITAQRRFTNISLFVILILFSLLFLFPFFWMLSTSLKSNEEVWAWPIKWIPDKLMWSNYKDALTILPFSKYFLNTTFIAVVNIIGQIVSCSIVAYTFARLLFPGKRTLFFILLSTMMMPGIITMIPTFVFFSKIGWVNTFWPLIVPGFFAGPFNTFLLRQFYMSLPMELDEAAKIDGCSTWGILWKILFPLTTPALSAIAVFCFMGSWNDFMGPLLYLQDESKYTVSLALSFFQGSRHTDWQLLMAASTVAMIPCLVIFLIAQKYIIGGISMSGLKG